MSRSCWAVWPAMVMICTIVSTGCLAVVAGGTAGLVGAAAYQYWKGTVRETIPANSDSVWQAAHAALADLGLPVIYSGSEGTKLILESRSPKDEDIRLELEPEKSSVPQAPPRTQLTIRVGTWGDEYLSRRILEQIYVRLRHGDPLIQAAGRQ